MKRKPACWAKTLEELAAEYNMPIEQAWVLDFYAQRIVAVMPPSAERQRARLAILFVDIDDDPAA
jgi:hypothetical protein